MEEKKRVKLLNFGADLEQDLIQEIENQNQIEIEEVRIKASLNLKKHSTYIQISDIIKKNQQHFKGEFIVNLPGLPIFSAMLVTEIHALTGKFPVILECVKDYQKNNMFSSFSYKRLYNLDRERIQSRENYKGETSKL